nr:immunoglobulin heavy chain junction region [Macaca mulatta]MPN69255.1 immunoglobulin heavy chain junction region [Macaca mulatta]MPN69258.1 immunoglobulin heavy chain junction region [Macaca mulatta]MPN69367.1 immunoglobulin heavy chain junction region [Macaca mulatta]MPN69526.1 immunoglobulin heavy chain junction region [Macaca mulatta]
CARDRGSWNEEGYFDYW